MDDCPLRIAFADPEQVYEIVLTPDTDGTVDATAHLQHSVADAMLQYSARGLFSEAQALTSDVTAQAEQLLHDKLVSTLAAAAGAYVLLALGALEQLHDWTENLFNWFDWFPDGAAIRAEHLAREGRHEEAAYRLVALESRGIPVFSDGLGYALRRLDVYAQTHQGPLRSRLNELHQQLLPFGLATDFSKAFTTFADGDCTLAMRP